MSKISAIRRYNHYKEWLMVTGRTRKSRTSSKPIVPMRSRFGTEDED